MKFRIPFQKLETTETGGEEEDLGLSRSDPPCGASISALVTSDYVELFSFYQAKLLAAMRDQQNDLNFPGFCLTGIHSVFPRLIFHQRVPHYDIWVHIVNNSLFIYIYLGQWVGFNSQTKTLASLWHKQQIKAIRAWACPTGNVRKTNKQTNQIIYIKYPAQTTWASSNKLTEKYKVHAGNIDPGVLITIQD